MIDDSVDWLHLYTKETVEAKIDDVHETHQAFIEELKKFTYDSVSDLQDKSDNVFKRVEATIEQAGEHKKAIDDLTDQFKKDSMLLM